MTVNSFLSNLMTTAMAYLGRHWAMPPLFCLDTKIFEQKMAHFEPKKIKMGKALTLPSPLSAGRGTPHTPSTNIYG